MIIYSLFMLYLGQGSWLSFDKSLWDFLENSVLIYVHFLFFAKSGVKLVFAKSSLKIFLRINFFDLLRGEQELSVEGLICLETCQFLALSHAFIALNLDKTFWYMHLWCCEPYLCHKPIFHQMCIHYHVLSAQNTHLSIYDYFSKWCCQMKDEWK